MNRDRIRDLLHDLALSVLAGGLIALATFILSFAIVLLAGGADVRGALFVSRSVLFIVGALLMVVAAGMMLRWPGEKKKKERVRWKEHYRVFGSSAAVIAAALTVLFAANALDFYLYYG